MGSQLDPFRSGNDGYPLKLKRCHFRLRLHRQKCRNVSMSFQFPPWIGLPPFDASVRKRGRIITRSCVTSRIISCCHSNTSRFPNTTIQHHAGITSEAVAASTPCTRNYLLLHHGTDSLVMLRRIALHFMPHSMQVIRSSQNNPRSES